MTTSSSASTAATESSRSMMVVMADSSTTSATPAGSSRPIWLARSILISMCRPWLRSSTGAGAALLLDDEFFAFDPVGHGALVAAAGERRGLVEDLLGARHHALAARLVVAAAALGAAVLRDC